MLLALLALLAPAGSALAGEAAPQPAKAPDNPPAASSPAAPADQPAPKPAAKPEAEPKKKPGAEDEVLFHAREQKLLVKEGVVLLFGSAWASHGDTKVEAERVVLWREKKQLYAEGAVRLTDEKGRLLADEIFYDFAVHRGRAKGVRLEIGRLEKIGGAARADRAGGGERGSDWPTSAWGIGRGLMAPPDKWCIAAPEIRRAGPGRWQVIGPSITSCDFEKPHWRLSCSSADYYPGDRVESFNNVIWVGDVPVFYFPYIVRDLAHQYPWTQWELGRSSEWGEYVLSKWGTGLPHDPRWPIQPTNAVVDADWRRERGWAYGLSLRYDALPHGGGHLDSYFLQEDLISTPDDRRRAEADVERRAQIYEDLRLCGAPKIIGRPKRLYEENLLFAERRRLDRLDAPNLDPVLYRDEFRFKLSAVHHEDFFRVRNDLHDEPVYALDLTAQFTDFSDRDFAREYFRNENRDNPEPVSWAMLRHQDDALGVELLAQPRIDEFDTRSEYLPQLRLDVPARPVGAGFFLAGSGDVGYLRRSFDEDSGFEDLEASRGHLRLVATRPLPAGPVSLNPYVGADEVWYSRSRAGHDEVRDAALYGADASTRFYGTYQVEGERLNIHGLRHTVEPRLFYRGVSNTSEDPKKLYDFDAVDDLSKTNVAGAELFHKFETKRRDDDGKERTADLAGLSLTASVMVEREEADRLNAGDRLLPLTVTSYIRPVEPLKIWSRQEIDPHGVGVAQTTEGVSVAWPERFLAELTYNTVTPDPDRDIRESRYLAGRVEVGLSEHWRAAASSAYEFGRPDASLGDRGFGDSRLSLIRSLHCWQISLDYSVQRAEDTWNRSVGVMVSPTGRSRNLTKGSDQLLLDGSDYGPSPWWGRPGELTPAP